MANKEITSLSSIMIFTGNNATKNAEALENRNYGYEDEFIGKLTKTTSNDSNWSNVPKEVFVETTPSWKNLNDLWVNGYTYITTKSVNKPSSEMYLDSSNIINFRYTYESDFTNNIMNNKIIPHEDIELALQSINNSLYNKQKYYAKFNELEYITYNGVKYYWQQHGAILDCTYTGEKYDISEQFVSYELISHTVQSKIWDEVSQSYIPQFETTTNEETGEVIQTPIYETQYSLNYIEYFDDIIKGKLENLTDKYHEKYGHLCAYYLYDLNNKISFIGNTYTFGKNNLDIYLNYDGEFNHWFDNRISFKVEGLPLNEDVTIASSIGTSNGWINIVKDENEKICGEDVYKDSLKTNFVIKNNQYENLNLGILNPGLSNGLNLSQISKYIVGEIDLLSNYDKKINYTDTISTNWIKECENNYNLTTLFIGNDVDKCKVTNLKGLEYLTNLQNLSIINCNNLYNSLDLTSLNKLKTFNATGSNICIFEPATNNNINWTVLPLTLETIKLNNSLIKQNLIIESIENLKTLSLINSSINKIIVNENEFSNEHSFINYWLNSLKEQDKLSCGVVNYINLENINWTNVELDTLLMLKEIELHNFTGNVEIIKNIDKQNISRKEYRQLVDLYGVNVFDDENNDMKFKIYLDNNAFKCSLLLFSIEIDEEGLETEEIINTFEVDIEDTTTGNSFLDYVQDNEIINLTFEDYINNNRINIGCYNDLEVALKMNKKSEKLNNLEIGDVLLYNLNKLIIVTKNIENINTNFVKVGKISNAEDLVNDIISMEKINTRFTALETI